MKIPPLEPCFKIPHTSKIFFVFFSIFSHKWTWISENSFSGLISDVSHSFALVVLWADAEMLNKIGHTTVSTLMILINAHSTISCDTWCSGMSDLWSQPGRYSTKLGMTLLKFLYYVFQYWFSQVRFMDTLYDDVISTCLPTWCSLNRPLPLIMEYHLFFQNWNAFDSC